MDRRRDLDKFVDDVRARQRNIVFPDTARNGRSVDAFFWNGSLNPPLVQRIAAWMFGLFFLALGLGFVGLAIAALRQDDSWIESGIWALISLALVLIGIRVFRNGFPRRRRAAPPENSN
jgi:hypothetical protein